MTGTALPPVTVVIPVKDRVELLARCLDGLFRCVERSTEIIVVDNSSRDGTYEMALGRVPDSPGPMRVLRVDRPEGPARNAALAEVTTDLVAFLDSDCVPQPGWLEAGVAGFDDPAIAVVQGRTLPDPQTPILRWAATQHIDGLSGFYEACNIFYRTDRLADGGGFAEELGFFCEDTVAGWSVVRTGGTAAYAPDAVVHHAVTHPGIRWFLRRASYYANWPTALKADPEMARSVLHGGLFLRRSHALLLMAVVGIAGSVRARPAALLAVPYLALRHPRGLQREDLVDWAGEMAFEARVIAALLRGSLRARRLVL